MSALADMQSTFNKVVKLEHIKYAWDGGHAYSYIDHPIVDVMFEDRDTQDTWEDFCNTWLSENEPGMPCEPVSSCGCNLGKSVGEIEEIIVEIMNRNDY